MIEVKRPGKLYIAGEYAVTQTGHRAIVVAIDKFIKISIKKSENTDKGQIKSFDNVVVNFLRDKKVYLEKYDNRFTYILSAINITELYLNTWVDSFDFYDIEIISEMEDDSGNKYGFGSSAAVTVAMVEAILKYYNADYDNAKLFKLSAIATLEINKKGSFGDLAAVVSGGAILYRKFDVNHVCHMLEKFNIVATVNANWEFLEIRKFDFPKSWKLYVGWTGKAASSLDLVEKIKHQEPTAREFHRDFLVSSEYIVEQIFEAFLTEDFDLLYRFIDQNRKLFVEFGNKYSSHIETDKLKLLSNIANKYHMASKLSGAGGGDCGIAIANNNENEIKLKDSWESKDIKFLYVNIYEG